MIFSSFILLKVFENELRDAEGKLFIFYANIKFEGELIFWNIETIHKHTMTI